MVFGVIFFTANPDPGRVVLVSEATEKIETMPITQIKLTTNISVRIRLI